MKTSTKLLLFVALLLIAVPVIHAHHLKNKIERNDYTLYSTKQKKPGEMVTIKSFDHIHIASLNNVAVEIRQGESTSLEKEHDLEINISQRGDTLFLEQALSPLDYNSDMKTITIRVPNLKSADITGAIHSDTSGAEGSREIRTYSLPSKVSIADFSGNQFQVQCKNGGEITLVNNTFKNTRITVGGLSSLNLTKDNTLDSLWLETIEGGKISVSGAAIKDLKSNIHPNSSLTLSGIEIK